MNMKNMSIGTIIVFIVFQALDFLIHGIILEKTYQSLAHIWRPEMMSMMWIMYCVSFCISILFVYIFIKGYENKGWIEGLRYGIILGLFMNIAGAFNTYVIYPIPFDLALKWFIYGVLEFVLAGIILSIVYKKINSQS